jgi:hypothetical protein
MAALSRLSTAVKAAAQLGLQPVMLNALYRLRLYAGHYRRIKRREKEKGNSASLQPLLDLPGKDQFLAVMGKRGRQNLLAEANEIAAGKVRLFGGDPAPLQLDFTEPLRHWTAYETTPSLLSPLYSLSSPPYSLPPDIKFLWEPARFGWAFTLGRAYALTGKEAYAESFWKYTESFLDANPPYLGPHWMSGQEVALRLMAFVWAAQAFGPSAASTPERMGRLARAVAEHAARIPPTLVYARSQQNNHLLTEAAGLLTAGLALPDHPRAARWRALGWRWLNDGLQAQIDGYGEYAQHSTNYHRLMLQVALWVDALIRTHDLRWPRPTAEALGRATHWLLALLDFDSGRTPNLGANDGAWIFPLTVCPFEDHRPVLHAAARAFLDYDLPHGPWHETSLWLGMAEAGPKTLALPRYLGDQIYGKDSWASLRTAQFASRPSHADQLHLDLWWRGLNVAQDAGTYLYNAPPPWDNGLTTALVHNTVTVNGRDQFTRAGRFLYLDWFNAYRQPVLDPDPSVLQRVRGRHWGYFRQGARHARTVTAFADGRWLVEDELLLLRFPWQRRPLTFRLHWLLPDWKWELESSDERIVIGLASPHGPVRLELTAVPRAPDLYSLLSVARAGESLIGPALVSPIRGWASPTYGLKVPALSLALEVRSVNEVKFTSEFLFP